MSITSQQREHLVLFCSRADSLLSFPVINEKVSFGVRISQEQGGPLRVQTKGPEVDEILRVVTIARQMYAQGEEIRFQKIYGIVNKSVRDSERLPDDVLNHLESAMVAYTRIMKIQFCTMKLGQFGRSRKDSEDKGPIEEKHR